MDKIIECCVHVCDEIKNDINVEDVIKSQVEKSFSKIVCNITANKRLSNNEKTLLTIMQIMKEIQALKLEIKEIKEISVIKSNLSEEKN
jgi:hypothetical protein